MLVYSIITKLWVFCICAWLTINNRCLFRCDLFGNYVLGLCTRKSIASSSSFIRVKCVSILQHYHVQPEWNFIYFIFTCYSVIGGPILGTYCLGMFLPFTNSIGAFVGTCTSLVFMLWIFIGYNVFGIKYPKKPFSIEGCNKTTNFTDLTTMSWLQLAEPRQSPIKEL